MVVIGSSVGEEKKKKKKKKRLSQLSSAYNAEKKND